MSDAAVLPVIMCGGAGTRLWPVSTDEAPKPFHGFGAKLTLFQATVQRFAAPGFLPPVVVCGQAHASLVREQLAAIGVTASAILLEPFGRGTAALAGMAAAIGAERHPEARILLAPADHAIADETKFREVVKGAVPYADERIVTFGVRPDRPETGYGYIRLGERLGTNLAEVAAFIEKPDATQAQALLAEGGVAWNAGIFLFAPGLMQAELARLAPDIAAAAEAAVRNAASDEAGDIHLDAASLQGCPDNSIDRAVMEKTDKAALAACEVGWTDVGVWNEVWRLSRRDPIGVATYGPAVALESEDVLVWSDGPQVGVFGVKDLVVVAAGGRVIVAPKSKAQAVRELAERMKAMKAPGA